MSVTSFIKPMLNRYGAFYTFQSAIDDITYSLNNNSLKFKFSKFALLRIPEFAQPQSNDNKTTLLAVGDTPMALYGGSITDQNTALTESFQNYCLNFESILMAQSTFNSENRRTVSERVFWKWLKETGATRYRAANALELTDYAGMVDTRFVEETEYDPDSLVNPYKYQRIVKYVGDIEVTHAVKRNNAYSEIYIYVPTNVGTSPYVLFNPVTDENYTENTTYFNNPEDILDIEYLYGRHASEEGTHPFGLDIHAFYDFDDGLVPTKYSTNLDLTSPSSTDWTDGYWWNPARPNSYNAYYTDQQFNIADNVKFMKEYDAATIEYIRNTLDGITIDFDLANYKLAFENTSIKTFADFNSYVGNKNFEYNAVLVYYELYDPSVDAAPTYNLYGIQFLNKVENSGAEFSIPYITKYKPDVFSKTNGNSYSHKINLKMDSSADTAAIEKSVNDYNTYSMDLFVDALTSMRNMASAYSENLAYIISVKNDLDALKNLYMDDPNKTELLARITALETSMAANQAIFDNTSTMMRYINDLYAKYNDIITNNTTLDVRYNLDPAILNSMITHPQSFNLGSLSRGNIINENIQVLNKYSNYFRHENASRITLSDSIIISIDDSKQKWSNGQIYEFVFDGEIDPSEYAISIVTDASNTLHTGVYGKTIAKLTATDFISSDTGYQFNYRPIYRITCIDAITLEFVVDKIR